MDKGLKVSIYTGYFGSGKTEFSLNKSISLAKQGKKVVLVDLDIVNPFFRSAEMKELLDQHQVRLIAPDYANTNMDLPTLPADVQSIFCMEDTEVIIDVGGDSDGATALGRYKPYFDKIDYEMHLVVNTLRPLSDNVDEIVEVAREIEKKSRLKLTDIVANTNLAGETSMEIIKKGLSVVEEAGEKLQLPIATLGVPETLINQVPKEYENIAFPIKRYMKPMWE